MTRPTPWHPIDSAPRDGTLCLLLDPALERNAYMPRGQKVHNDCVVVGRWPVPENSAVKSDWVTDIRTIHHDGDQPYWDACVIEPSHWMPLPNAPPGGQWIAADRPPIAFEFVLLHVPGLGLTREHPMATGGLVSTGFDMIVGCHCDDAKTAVQTWLTDLCESHQIDNDPEDLGVAATRVCPAFWMALPQPPTVVA